MIYNLHKAHKVKNDEFYTHMSDIDNELQHYKDIFAGKIIYCNCDNPNDYDGKIGVPISFIEKYNPNQFDIIYNLRPIVNGVFKYQRIIIKNKYKRL